EAIVATVSLGEPRRFLLRPREGGRGRAFMLGWGDLSVMGGACQRTWRHAIPKAANAGPRIAVMYRPIWTPPP
ncbi:MAG TPA: alpha-ketoglutarate-dependent dioxygenase AlkB, partial [Polyangia bacterium]